MAKEEEEEGLPLRTTVDDETFDELGTLTGQRIVHIDVWEDSLGSALEEEEIDPAEQVSFDVDLYLADGAYFELYSVACFDSPDGEPWTGLEPVGQRLAALGKRNAVLEEIAVDEEDQLVLVVRHGADERIYLPVAAWLLEEWDELPGG